MTWDNLIKNPLKLIMYIIIIIIVMAVNGFIMIMADTFFGGNLLFGLVKVIGTWLTYPMDILIIIFLWLFKKVFFFL